MKRIALVLVVFFGGICALSYWNGLRIERGFRENMEQALAAGADLPGLDVTQSFERGFLGSTAHATLQSTAGGPAIRLKHRIAHGPIPWAGLRHGGKLGRSWIATEVAFDLTAQPALAQVFSELPPIQITTHLRTSGDGVSEFYWAPFETQTPDGGSVAVREMRGEIEFGGANEEAVGSIEWGGVHLDTPQFSVKMAPLRGEFAYEDVLKSTVYGQSSFSLESVEATAGGQSVGDLRNLHWAEQRAVEDGKLFLRSQVSLESVEVMTFLVRELSLESQFENVDLAVWEQARASLQALRRKQHGTRLTAAGDVQPGATDPAQMIELLRTFLAADPSLRVQGRAIVNDEVLSFESAARSGAGPLPEGQDLEAFGRAIDADLLLHVPRALLDPWMERRGSKAAQLRMLVERGVLRSTPNAYETRLQYESGKLRINGVPADALNSLGQPSS